MTKEQRNKKLELIRNQVETLLPSFDTVTIFATKYDPEANETYQFNLGAGNWFARYGQVREWLNYEEKVGDREKDS